MELQALREQATQLGVDFDPVSDSRVKLIRAIQRGMKQDPCFATDERYWCRRDCQWKADCNGHGLVATWR
jgi:hypothetical protein